MPIAVNFIAFQAGWFACVLGGAWHLPLAGSALALAIVAAHLCAAAAPGRELALLAAAAAFGAVFDSLLVAAGWLAYPSGTLFAGTAPYWIVAMWALFATTLNVSLRWLRGRAWLAAVLGALGGPLAFLAGERLGAVVFVDRGAGLAALAAGWAVVMPALVQLSRRLDGFPAVPGRELREAGA